MMVLPSEKQFIIKKEILYCLISGIIGLIAAYFFLGLGEADLRVPFVYTGDAFTGLTVAQNFITGNGRFIFPNIGAPGIVTTANFPDAHHIDYFGMWIFSLFIKEAGLLVNIFYLSTYFSISFFAALSLRLLYISPPASIIGGVLYALLPFHFYRGVSHLMLSTYAVVPLACVVIIWIIDGKLQLYKPDFAKRKGLKNRLRSIDKKFLFAAGVALYLGLSNIYFVYFACLGIVFAAFWNLLEDKKIKNLIVPIILLAITSITVVISLIPNILFILNGGESFLTGTRNLTDIELYALRITEMILPVRAHRIPLFAAIRNFYETRVSFFAPGFTESAFSSLGLFISLGFVLSFIFAMVRNSKIVIENNIFKHSAVLNTFMILLASMGGFSSIIGIFAPSVRCYNRISIFIAFYSLFIVLFLFDKFTARFVKTKYLQIIIIVIIGVLASFDMVSVNVKVKPTYNEIFYTRQEFISKVEEVTPAGSMVFQLPFIPSTQHTPFVNIAVYEHFTPFVHSKSLKWSYRAQIGSDIEVWQATVSQMSIDYMLENLIAAGFAGVYIDSFGYTEDEHEPVIHDIRMITGTDPIVSRDGRYYYFIINN